MFGMPVLSNDGDWVAWAELVPGTKRRRAVLQSLSAARVQSVRVPDQRPSQWMLLAADVERKELTFYEYNQTTRRSSLTMLGLDTEQQVNSIVVQGVDAQFATILRVGSGWVAWDAAREPREHYRVAWSLPNGQGTHEASRGQSFTAVKVAPDGAYIAISETSTLRDSVAQDSVYLLRASDGKEVWHRNLPRSARSWLAFLSEKLFAYTDSDGAHYTVRVLQIPD
jgi:hypothetical protein